MLHHPLLQDSCSEHDTASCPSERTVLSSRSYVRRCDAVEFRRGGPQRAWHQMRIIVSKETGTDVLTGAHGLALLCLLCSGHP